MPGGELPVAGGDRILAPIKRLIREGGFDEIGDVHEEHPARHISFASTHGKKPYETFDFGQGPTVLWPDHALAGTANARLHPSLACERITFRCLKGLRADAECYGSFAYADGQPTELEDILSRRNIGALTIVGLATDYCVGETALQAAARRFATTVVLEACRGVAPGTTAAKLKALRAANVRIVDTVDEA
jgi:nicotinamidase/pyrazinamidase